MNNPNPISDPQNSTAVVDLNNIESGDSQSSETFKAPTIVEQPGGSVAVIEIDKDALKQVDQQAIKRIQQALVVEATPKPTQTQETSTLNKQSLEGVTSSEAWKNLKPNSSNPNHLLPGDIPHLDQVLATVASPDLAKLGYDDPFDISVAGVGTISKIGKGETKTVFRLKTPEGKTVVLQLQQGFNAAMNIPQDERIYTGYYIPLDNGQAEVHGYYSDARTYLSVPVGRLNGRDDFGVHIVEDLGSTNPQDLFGVGRRTSKKEAENYIRGKGFTVEDPTEFSQKRNFFKQPGAKRLAVNDIPITRVVRRGK